MKKLLLLFVFLPFIACNDAVVSDSTKDFDDNRWAQDDVKSFSLELGEDIAKGNLILNFSHIFDPGYNSVPVAVAVTTPDGNIETIMANLELRSKSGKDLGNCTGDICDLSQIIKKGVPFKAGMYKITVQNGFSGPYLPNVLVVGVAIGK
ncbi:MAG: hypothetical protein ACO1N9_03895 [Flavobacterium sp.]